MCLRSLIIVLLMFPLTLSAAVIDVRERVTVEEGALLRLKDVARVTDADPVKAAALGEITLMPAPASGRSQRLAFDELRTRLQAHGVNLAELEFLGQQATTIATNPPPMSRPPRIETTKPTPPLMAKPSTKLQQGQADQLMQTAVQRAFRLTAAEALPVRVSCTCEAHDVPLILATTADRIRFAERQLPVGTPQALTAQWSTADGTTQSAVVQVFVDLAPRRLAVRHPIPAGYPLQADDLEWVTGDVDPQAVTQLTDAVGKETTRTLKAGMQLSADMLTNTPLVRTNDIVTVQVRRPGVAVRRMFKALSAGALHDTVTLVAVDDPRLRMQGVVTGYHEATVIEQPVAPSRNSAPGERP
jgi:flagella basal body P-ring formation protein FlgA